MNTNEISKSFSSIELIDCASSKANNQKSFKQFKKTLLAHHVRHKRGVSAMFDLRLIQNFVLRQIVTEVSNVT